MVLIEQILQHIRENFGSFWRFDDGYGNGECAKIPFTKIVQCNWWIAVELCQPFQKKARRKLNKYSEFSIAVIKAIIKIQRSKSFTLRYSSEYKIYWTLLGKLHEFNHSWKIEDFLFNFHLSSLSRLINTDLIALNYNWVFVFSDSCRAIFWLTFVQIEVQKTIFRREKENCPRF